METIVWIPIGVAIAFLAMIFFVIEETRHAKPQIIEYEACGSICLTPCPSGEVAMVQSCTCQACPRYGGVVDGEGRIYCKKESKKNE